MLLPRFEDERLTALRLPTRRRLGRGRAERVDDTMSCDRLRVCGDNGGTRIDTRGWSGLPIPD